MKLFAKYNRVNFIATVIIFLLGCLAFALLLRYVVINQIDEDLKIEKNEITTYVGHFHHLPSVVEVHDQYTSYQPVEKPGEHADRIYTHEVFNKHDHEKELRRIIEFYINAEGNWYLVNVSKSLQATDELIRTIIIITVSVIMLILIVTFIINRIILRKLWQPFYRTLQHMQQFDVNKAQTISLGATEINEFQYLNLILSETLAKAQKDYQTLKEFTENASHELQTPLAVIHSKLDILIQNENLSESESNTIQSAYDAVQNLNKLNQSLLLLAKIENKQFSETTNIDLKELLQNKINQFCELWKNQNLKQHFSLSPKTISGNKYLIEILLNNLLSNATKHNKTNGAVNILLDDVLKITNTGATQPLDENLLYKRFSSQNKEANSYGLGLSIIQQICIASEFTCTYNFDAPDKHTFTINW